MNTRLSWQTDTWYALVTRCWPAGSHTYYGCWYRDGVSGKWRHLVTMDVAAANSLYTGGNGSFIEDWSDTGRNRRETHLRGGWKRLVNGSRRAATTARYSDLLGNTSVWKFFTVKDGAITLSVPVQFRARVPAWPAVVTLLHLGDGAGLPPFPRALDGRKAHSPRASAGFYLPDAVKEQEGFPTGTRSE